MALMMTKGLETAINQLGQVQAYILSQMQREYDVDGATIIELDECLSQVHLFLVSSVLSKYRSQASRKE
jgi:hypothetical protein